MRQLCGVSILFFFVFIVAVLFLSIMIMAFFLPDIPSEREAPHVSASRVIKRHATSVRNTTFARMPSTGATTSFREFGVIWDFGACGCTGWGVEAVNFVLPLIEHLPHLGIVSGPDCFCPGLDAHSLALLQTMRTNAEQMAALTRPTVNHQLHLERQHDESVVFVPRPNPRRVSNRLRTQVPIALASNPLDAVVDRLEDAGDSDDDDSQAESTSRQLLSIARRLPVTTKAPTPASAPEAESKDGHGFFRLLRPRPEVPNEPLPPWRPKPVDIWISHKPPQRFPHWPYMGLLQFDQRPRYIVGRSMTEVDRISAAWVAACKLVDELWVPSQHSRQVFAAGGVPLAKLHVIGEAVDTRILAPAIHARIMEHSATYSSPASFPWSALAPCREDDFVFLSVFKWEWRKGWDVLLRAYFTEFLKPSNGVEDDSRADEFDLHDTTRRDASNVCLVIKTYLFGEADANNVHRIRSRIVDFATRQLKLSAARLPRFAIVSEVLLSELCFFSLSWSTVVMFDRVINGCQELPGDSMAALYRRAHAFVLPTRGEGWCLPLMEAMVAGVPSVVTEWGGHLEFAHARAHMIRVASMSNAQGADFSRGQRWAEPDVRHLQLIMHQLERGLPINGTTVAESSQQPAEGLNDAELQEWKWRYGRLATSVRQQALRAQTEVLFYFDPCDSISARAQFAYIISVGHPVQSQCSRSASASAPSCNRRQVTKQCRTMARVM
jgi:glycosyltransferase involved in cell wall biosynthesis